MRRSLTVALVLFVCTMVIGCAARVPKVPMPGESAGPVEWKAYYDDQFKALKDDVPPPGEQASLEQRVAYQDAKHSYEKQKVVGMIVSGCLLAIALGSLLGTLSQL